MNTVHKATLICFFVITICFSGFTHAGEPIRIVVDAYNPPNMYLHDGRASGLYPILLEAIFKHLEQDVSVDAAPWKRAMDMSAQGTVGIAGIYKTPQRLLIYDYSDPMYAELLLVFVKKENTFKFQSVHDLEGKKIGTILGWSYGEEFDSARSQNLFKTEAVNRDRLNFKKLMDGRLDCIVASKESGLHELASSNYSDIIQLKKPLLNNPVYVAFAQHAKKKDLLIQFNAALKTLKKTGEYDRIVEKFMNGVDFRTFAPAESFE